jgi:hypothetical protein
MIWASFWAFFHRHVYLVTLLLFKPELKHCKVETAEAVVANSAAFA